MSQIETSWITLFCTYLGFVIAIIAGNLEELYEKLFIKKDDNKHEGYAPIVNDFEYFFSKRMFGKIRDCWDRPISSNPGAEIDVLLRESPMEIGFDGLLSSKPLGLVGETKRALNLGSYNYLGFADRNAYCRDSTLEVIDKFGTSMCSTRSDAGNSVLHKELEERMAKFIGKEAAVVFGMGFQTNSTVLPILVGKGDLVISDQLNHSSIVTGCRSSVSKIATFKHNDVEDLEKVIRDSIIKGQPGTGRAWKKIMIVVEGIYSMEGDICKLKEIVQVVKKYKCYIYVDEAHSIGALGNNGRGVCEYAGVDPKDIDILMGTFTKSFGSVGGYIAANKETIEYIKNTCFAFNYDTSLSPPCIQQIISAIKILTGEDGTDLGRKRLDQLRENSNFFRKRLKEYGFQIIGDENSPIVPLMIQVPGNLGAFSRMCLHEGIAVVVVGFPATPILQSRTRFCISAGHTKQQLVEAADKINRIGKVLHLHVYPETFSKINNKD